MSEVAKNAKVIEEVMKSKDYEQEQKMKDMEN